MLLFGFFLGFAFAFSTILVLLCLNCDWGFFISNACDIKIDAYVLFFVLQLIVSTKPHSTSHALDVFVPGGRHVH